MDCGNNGKSIKTMSYREFYNLKSEQKQILFQEIQKEIPIPPVSIEKDWWVVQTLTLVFKMEDAPYLVFKGGTSLSKAWKIIERLSEDVDLALSRELLGFEGKISRTQVGKLRDASFKYISEHFLPQLSKTIYSEIALSDKQMYKSMVEHREHFMRWGGIDYSTHFPPNLNSLPPSHLLSAFESDYKTMQEEMIYGESLPFTELMKELKSVTSKINSIKF